MSDIEVNEIPDDAETNVSPGADPDPVDLGQFIMRNEKYDAYLDGESVRIYAMGAYDEPIHEVFISTADQDAEFSTFVARVVDEARDMLLGRGAFGPPPVNAEVATAVESASINGGNR